MTEVDIYSFGMDTSFCRFGDALPVTKLMSDAKRNYRRSDERNAIQAKLAREFIVEYINNHTFDLMPSNFVVIDCRGFYESKDTLIHSKSRGHTGLHPENAVRIMQHKHFNQSFLPDFYQQFEDAMKNSRIMQRRRIGIAVYCNKGRDRSVGCAELLRKLLLSQKHKCPEFQVRVKHICKSEWRSTDGRSCPPKCKFCDGQLDNDMDFAREYDRHNWKSVKW